MLNAIPYRDPQDAPIVCACNRCGKELYAWEIREGEWGQILCPECEEEEYGEKDHPNSTSPRTERVWCRTA